MVNFSGVYSKDGMLAKTQSEQEEIFNVIKEAYGDKKKDYELLISEAKNGNTAIQDFIAYLFFNGTKRIKKNKYIASLWALVACANGSRLSDDRVRELIRPAYAHILESIETSILLDTYNLNKNNYEEFLSCSVADTFLRNFNISVDEILKIENNSDEYTNEKLKELTNFRDENIDIFVDDLCL